MSESETLQPDRQNARAATAFGGRGWKLALRDLVRGRRRLVLLVALVVALPIAGVVFGLMARSKPGQKQAVSNSISSLFGNSGATFTKPPAGKPLVAAPPPPPPIPVPRNTFRTAPPNSQTLEIPPGPAVPPSSPENTAPAPPSTIPAMPPTTGKAPYTPVVYPARHDKHFGGSCNGQLSLSSSGLQFNCPDDPGGSVQVAINDVEAVDENGIRLSSGKKYHFSIPGMNKGSEEQLFSDWLSRVR